MDNGGDDDDDDCDYKNDENDDDFDDDWQQPLYDGLLSWRVGNFSLMVGNFLGGRKFSYRVGC